MEKRLRRHVVRATWDEHTCAAYLSPASACRSVKLLSRLSFLHITTLSFLMRNRVDCRWDVVVVAMLTTLFAVATNRTMGWFFVAYMDEFGLGRQTASWPGFVILGCHRVSGLLVGMLHKHLSLFLIGLLGSFFAWGGITVSAFAPSIAWMSFTTGFVHGMGSGIVIQAHTVVVLQHFSKYRGVATGITCAANPTSALLFPAVLTALSNAYGFRGMLIVYSAIIMHISALCLILKEPPWASSAGTITETRLHGHQEAGKTSPVLTGSDVKLFSKVSEPAAAAISMKKIHQGTYRRSLVSLQEGAHDPQGAVDAIKLTTIDDDILKEACSEITEQHVLLSQTSVNFRTANSNHADSSSHNSQEAHLQACPLSANCFTSPQGFSEEVHQLKAAKKNSQNISQANTTPKETAVAISRECGTRQPAVSKFRHCTISRQRLRRVLRCVLPTRFSAASFIVAVLGSTLLDYVNVVHLFTMVDYARDKGVSYTHAVMALTYAAVPELLGRLLLPLIADIGWVSRPFLACGYAIAAALLFGVTPETAQTTHLVVRGLSSVLMGALVTMKTVLVADYMGAEAVCIVAGVSGSLLVPALLCNPLIFGFFRDYTGSYDNLYRIVAGIIFCAGLGLFACLVRSSRSKSMILKESEACDNTENDPLRSSATRARLDFTTPPAKHCHLPNVP